MADAQPFDPALFADAAIDAETAKLNADMTWLVEAPSLEIGFGLMLLAATRFLVSLIAPAA